MSGNRMSAIKSTQHFQPCHCTKCFMISEIDRLEGVASERRQRIRDGWNVEFDRETGHELWVLDDPPLVGEKQ